MKKELVDKFAMLITSALGLVAALAWNDAIKGLFDNLQINVYGLWVYAVAVTFMAVLLTYWIGKLAQKKVKK